jgi:hypothetical protein
MLDYCEPIPTSEWHEKEPSWIEAALAERRKSLQEARAFAAALVASKVAASPSVAEQSLEERFREYADKWESQTAFLSATPMRILNDSYQSIMAMGPEVVPILLRDLQKTQRHWFWALRHLTSADPVPEKDRGTVDRMIAAWIAWGKAEGKI